MATTAYNFKSIQIVPEAKDLVDTVLTRTQRKTPTVIHANFAISRIRTFYMRKIKFTQQTIHDKLTLILDQFPRMDNIHPFYADLMNVLYDRDHYKLALSQLNTARHIIDNLAKDYVRLVKFGESLFKCKQLKRAAMGRMCTLLRQQGKTLAYLEEVRKHLSRLPSIDPNTRTLLVTGYPNVGKSSFMNKVTRADVDVQPYAFTTKSIFVGHMDYQYQRWQVLDTPGILDHPLEERNTIEMQAITALAHLHCAILYFIDISEQCGFTIDQQISLFNNIKPLFVGKPLIVVATKIDVMPLDKLDAEYRTKIETMVKESGAMFETMSNFTEEGINEVKVKACGRLLKDRVAIKMKGKKMNDIRNRVTVTEPTARDDRPRPPTIPPSVLAARAAKAAAAEAAAAAEEDEDDIDFVGGAEPVFDGGAGAGVGVGWGVAAKPVVGTGPGGRVLAKDLETARGGPGVFRFDMSSHYKLKDDAWATDVIPEIMDGKNISDFVDADIEERLLSVEKEEEEQMKKLLAKGDEVDPDASSDEDEATKSLAAKIRGRKMVVVRRRRADADRNYPRMPRKALGIEAGKMKKHLESVGVEPAAAMATAAAKTKKRGRSLTRRAAADDEDEDGDESGMGGAASPATPSEGIGEGLPGVRRTKSRSKSRGPRDRSLARSASRGEPLPGSGLKDAKQKDQAHKLMKKKQRKIIQNGMGGEADRFIGTKMPRHLFSGKRGIGKTDRR